MRKLKTLLKIIKSDTKAVFGFMLSKEGCIVLGIVAWVAGALLGGTYIEFSYPDNKSPAMYFIIAYTVFSCFVVYCISIIKRINKKIDYENKKIINTLKGR